MRYRWRFGWRDFQDISIAQVDTGEKCIVFRLQFGLILFKQISIHTVVSLRIANNAISRYTNGEMQNNYVRCLWYKQEARFRLSKHVYSSNSLVAVEIGGKSLAGCWNDYVTLTTSCSIYTWRQNVFRILHYAHRFLRRSEADLENL